MLFRSVVIGPCGLGHTRLAVIDPESSAQPMCPPDSRISVVYNGALYNYKALRAELAGQGSPFVTAGDTEVVLRAIERCWTDGLGRLDGMFAVAAWDDEDKRLARERYKFYRDRGYEIQTHKLGAEGGA